MVRDGLKGRQKASLPQWSWNPQTVFIAFQQKLGQDNSFSPLAHLAEVVTTFAPQQPGLLLPNWDLGPSGGGLTGVDKASAVHDKGLAKSSRISAQRLPAVLLEPVGHSSVLKGAELLLDVDDVGGEGGERLAREEGQKVVPRRRTKRWQGGWRVRSGVVKQLFCGAFAGVVSRSAVAPIDLVKTHLITAHGRPGANLSAWAVASGILKAEGWQGLFRGNGTNCIRVAPCKAVEYFVFENLKRALNKDGHPLKLVAAPVAGGAAGMMSTLVTYPLELIRTRITIQPHLYHGIIPSIQKIVAEEGVGALYRGLRPSLLGVFPYAATHYGVYSGLRTAYKKATKTDVVPTLPTLLFGAAAAAASSAVTYPIEVARRQMQLGTLGGSRVVCNNALQVISTIYAQEGFYALYRGLGTTFLKLIPAAAVSSMCYEAARNALRVDDASIKAKERRQELLDEEREHELALQAGEGE